MFKENPCDQSRDKPYQKTKYIMVAIAKISFVVFMGVGAFFLFSEMDKDSDRHERLKNIEAVKGTPTVQKLEVMLKQFKGTKNNPEIEAFQLASTQALADDNLSNGEFIELRKSFNDINEKLEIEYLKSKY